MVMEKVKKYVSYSVDDNYDNADDDNDNDDNDDDDKRLRCYQQASYGCNIGYAVLDATFERILFTLYTDL